MKRLRRSVAASLAAIAFLLVFGAVALANGPDPTGTATFEADPNKAVNFAWTLIAGFLVWFMQAGFAMLGAGLIRAKNTVNYLTKSFLDFCMCALAFWAFGFAIMFGGSELASGLDKGNSFFGFSGFFLSGDAFDVSTLTLWFFQMVFAATAATIVAGAMAERTKITAYLAYSFLVSALIYPIYGKWMWGGGWLASLPFGAGARDFAGSGVVHTIGGTLGLMGAWMVGPRIGKFAPDGTPRTIPGHSMTLAVLGTFILYFGWFGFNPGSTMAATDLRISAIAVATFLAGAAGAVTAAYISLLRTGKVDIGFVCNGALVGLVGITAPSAYVAPWAAIVIGVLAVPVMMFVGSFVEKVLKVDDPVGAIQVHTGGGIWGLLAVGLFADGTYGGVSGLIVGETGQMVAQLIDAVVTFGWASITGLVLFGLIKLTIGLRASREEELEGLDVSEHGVECYPVDWVPTPAGAAK